MRVIIIIIIIINYNNYTTTTTTRMPLSMGFNRNYFNKWMNKIKTEIFDDEKLNN